MKRKLIIFALMIIGIGLILFQSYPFSNNKIGKAQSPNIIVIMADDMGFSDPGFMGSGINTPNIDRLANNGIVFNQFYNAGRCCPTRASLLTGLYAHNAGLGWMTASDSGLPGYRGTISDKSVTIAQVLKEAGYANYISGKWHVTYNPNMEVGANNSNWPLQRGFDKYYGMLSGGGGYYQPTRLTHNNNHIIPQEDFYLTQAINDSTISFLEQHFETKKEQPFFFYVAHYAPHRPLHALKEDILKYKGKFSYGWDFFREQRYQIMKEYGIVNDEWFLSDRPTNIPAWDSISDRDKAMWETRMEIYAAQIDRMDQGIGRIISLLEQEGELDNTMILFLSDNGGSAESEGKDFDVNTIQDIGGNSFNQSYRMNWANMSNAPFRLYKSSNHEGGISTPLIVHWPEQIKKASISKHQGHVVDLMSTFIDVAEARYPTTIDDNEIKGTQGMSLLPVLKGGGFDRGAIYFEHQGSRAIIEGNWKLVALHTSEPPYTKKWELYDLSSDRTENMNLLRNNPEIAKQLMIKWNNWAEENNVLPLDGRRWSARMESDVNMQKDKE